MTLSSVLNLTSNLADEHVVLLIPGENRQLSIFVPSGAIVLVLAGPNQSNNSASVVAAAA